MPPRRHLSCIIIDLMVATFAAFIGGLLVAQMAGGSRCCHLCPPITENAVAAPPGEGGMSTP